MRVIILRSRVIVIGIWSIHGHMCALVDKVCRQTVLLSRSISPELMVELRQLMKSLKVIFFVRLLLLWETVLAVVSAAMEMLKRRRSENCANILESVLGSWNDEAGGGQGDYCRGISTDAKELAVNTRVPALATLQPTTSVSSFHRLFLASCAPPPAAAAAAATAKRTVSTAQSVSAITFHHTAW